MATYGKNKRSLLSGFSVLRDDQPASAVTSRPSAPHPSRLGRAKSAMQNSRGRQLLDDDSGDELAGDWLLNHQAQQPLRSSLQSDAAPSEYSKTKSNRTDRNKPLPPIPAPNLPGDVIPTKERRAVLTSKSTNLKLSKKGLPARPKISKPVLQVSEDNDHNTALRAINGIPARESTHGLQTSVDDAENLSRKISTLMQQAAAREVEDATATATAKASPLQRSKVALSKATQALTSRFSNSSRRPSVSKARQSEPSSSGLVGLEYQADPKSRLGAIKRGDNAADSMIPRKPLPVYDSMKTVGHSSGSLQDPFSDGNEMNGRPSPEIQATFDFDFNKRKRKGKQTRKEQAASHGSTLNNHITTSKAAQTPSGFSNKISGLTQHPNTMIFSSPPIGFSTPSSRLYPPLQPPHDSPRPSDMAKTPSILEFSFEESDEEDNSELKDSQATDHSLSVKRKSAKEDLRAQLSPLSKRARKCPDTLKDELDPTSSPHRMDTLDSGPLIENDRGMKFGRPVTSDGKAKGLSMIEAAVEKGPLVCIGDKIKRPRARTTAAKRLSIPTPNSILFSRESRAHYRLRDTTDGDTIDVDELQMDDGGYRVRPAKKD